MCAGAYVRCLPEEIRSSTYNLLVCVEDNTHVILANTADRGVSVISKMKCLWINPLITSYFDVEIVFCSVWFLYMAF